MNLVLLERACPRCVYGMYAHVWDIYAPMAYIHTIPSHRYMGFIWHIKVCVWDVCTYGIYIGCISTQHTNTRMGFVCVGCMCGVATVSKID